MKGTLLMEDATKIVDTLTDVKTVMLLRQVGRRVFAELSIDEVRKSAVSTGILTDVSVAAGREQLDPESSVAMARYVLRGLARDSALAPLVVQAYGDIEKDDGLLIETVVALGLIVNLTMLIAASEVEFKAGGLTFKKGKVSADEIKQIVEPVVELVKRFPAPGSTHGNDH
jgi:hypothetical protein